MIRKVEQSSPQVLASQYQQGRKDLWNVQEPGDPYDIRKSMIAKMPGGKMFMGENLQIVCLLQAAELQRLNDFLQSYKIKFRDLERNELDRHSYEVQIKELMHKIQDLDHYERENQKLKDFVQNQSNENEQLRQSIRDKINQKELGAIYQQSQDAIKELKKQNSSLKENQESYNSQIRELTLKLQSYERAKVKEIEEIKQNYKRTSSYDKEKQQNQQAMHVFKLNIQSKLEKMNSEIKYLKEINDSKMQQINMLKEDNVQLENKMRMSRSQPDQQLQSLKRDYQAKLESCHKQIVRLTFQLDQAHRQNEILHRDNLSYQEKIIKEDLYVKESQIKLKNKDDQISQLHNLIRSLESSTNQHSHQSQLSSYQHQNTIKKLHERIDSLSKKLEAEELSAKMTKQHADRHMHQNFVQLQEMIRQNDQLRREALENSQTKRQLVHLQNQRVLLIQDIERQQELINSKNNESNQNRILTTQNQTLKAKVNQIERSLDFKHQSELIKLRTEYEYKINQLSAMQGNELQSRSFMIEQQLRRCKDLLKQKTEEADRYRNNSFEWQTKYTQLELNNNYKIQNVDHGNRQLEMKLVQAQNRAAILEDQIKRINDILRNRDEQKSTISRKLKQFEDQMSRKQFEDSQRGSQYAHTLSALRGENEQLKKRLNQLLKNNNNISNQTINEINRLNAIIRTLQQEKQQFDNKNRQLAYELDHQNQNYNLIIREKDDLKRNLFELETKNRNISVQGEANLKRIQYQNENLRRQLQQMRLAVSTYENEVQRKVSAYEKQIQILTQEDEGHRNRTRDFELKVSQYSLNLQNLQQQYKYKCQQYSALDSRCQNILVQNENLKRQFRQNELRFEKDTSQRYKNYETTIQNLNRQRQESKRRYIQIESKYNHLNTEYSQLTVSLRKVNEDNQNLKKTTSQREGLVSSIKSQVDRTIQQYQISIQNLKKENQDLQRRLNEKDNLIKQKDEGIMRLQANNNNLIREVEHFKNRYKDLEQTMTHKMEGQVYQKFILYDQTITKLADQNQSLRKKLNEAVIEANCLRPLTNEVENLKKTVSNYESSIALYEKEVSSRFSNYDRERKDLQRKIEESNQASKRVGMSSKDQISNLTRQLDRITHSYKELERYNGELKTRLKDSGELGKVVNELQSKLALVSQQLQRTNQNLRSKIDQFNKLEVKNRNLMVDLQTSRRQQIQLQTHYNNTLENEINRKQQTHQQSVSELKRRISDLQGKIQVQNTQLQRISNNIRMKVDESNQVTINFRNIQNEYQQFKRRAKQTEMINSQSMIALRKQNEDYRQRFQQYDMGIRRLSDENNRKIVEYQNKIVLLKSEQERVYNSLQVKTRELNQVMKHSKQMQINLHQENEDLKRKVYELNQSNLKIPQYDQKLRQVIQENDKLQQSLRVRNEELHDCQNRLRQYIFEVQQANKKAVQIQNSLIDKYEREANLKSKNFQQNMNSLSQQRGNLQRKMMEYQSNILSLTKQIQRLNTLIRGKAEELQRMMIESEQQKQNYSRKLYNSENELNQLRINYERLVHDCQEKTTHMERYQSSTEKLHSQFERLQMVIEELKKQRQNLFEKNFTLSDEIERLTEKNKDLELQTKDIRLRLADESSLQKRINEHLALMVVLFAEIESLRQIVDEKEKEVEQVRRTSLSPNILRH